MLTSLQNEQVKYVVNLHKRKFREETGEFLIEGWRFVEEGVRRGAQLTRVFVCPKRQNELWPSLAEALRQKNVPVIEVDERVLLKMSDTENPQGILAIVKQPKWTWGDLEDLHNIQEGQRTIGLPESRTSRGSEDSQGLRAPQGLQGSQGTQSLQDFGASQSSRSLQGSEESMAQSSSENLPLLLILDGVQDPGNCGTILRTALAAGVTHVCLTEGTVDLYNLKALRSTMGAIFSLKILTHCQPEEILDFCQKKRIPVLTGDVQGTDLYEADLSLPFALVVGNEGNGPSAAFRSSQVTRITIPMSHQVESLNVAMATGIILYETRRRSSKRTK